MSTFDFVRVNAVIQRSANCLVETLKQLLDGLAFTAHHCGEHGVLVGGYRCAFDVSDLPKGDVCCTCK